jgi:hypothetical protein
MSLPVTRTALALLAILVLGGCAGYRVGNTSGRSLQGVRSVYVPVARNTSLEPDLQMTVTNAVIRRFNRDILITAQYQLTIQATATYVNRRLGRKIFENVAVTGSTTFFTQSDIQEGERQALPLAADDLANNAVKLITEGW